MVSAVVPLKKIIPYLLLLQTTAWFRARFQTLESCGAPPASSRYTTIESIAVDIYIPLQSLAASKLFIDSLYHTITIYTGDWGVFSNNTSGALLVVRHTSN